MSRTCRMEIVGGLYHVMFRGNRRQSVFLEDDDRLFLLSKVLQLKSRFDLEIYAFALMPNHVHLLLRRMHDPIAGFMAALLTTFARHFNRRYGLVGHVFQGRYRCLLCEDETYLLRLVRYIHRNPLRAGLSSGVEFAWSSYSAYFGRGPAGLVDPEPVLSHFGKEPVAARAAFRAYHESEVAAADTKENFMPRRGVFLGGETFEERARRRAARSGESSPPDRPPLHAILRESLDASNLRVDPVEVRGPSRRLAAALARAMFVELAIERHQYRYVEVAGFLRRSPDGLRVMLARRRVARESTRTANDE